MKRTKNILLVLCMMLMYLSCYDDTELQKRIDALEKAHTSYINNVDGQIKAIQNSISSLADLQNSLVVQLVEMEDEFKTMQTFDAEQSDRLSKAESDIQNLKDMVQQIEVMMESLRHSMEEMLLEQKTWAEITFATLEQQNVLSEFLVSTKSELEEMINSQNSDNAAEFVELVRQIQTVESSLKTWVNEHLANYYDIATVDTKLHNMLAIINECDEASKKEHEALTEQMNTLERAMKEGNEAAKKEYEALSEKLEALENARNKEDETLKKELTALAASIEAMKKELTTAYQSAIKTAIEENDGTITKQIAKEIATINERIDTALAELDARIRSIESRLDTLEQQMAELTKQLDIIFLETEDIVYSAGSTILVRYTLINADDKTIVEVIADADWKAKVVSTGKTEGYIEVVTSAKGGEGKVLVLVNKGNSTIMRALRFEEGVLTVLNDIYTIEAEGGNISVTAYTNLEDYKIVIPTEAQGWLSVSNTSSRAAMHDDLIILRVDPNSGHESRSAFVKITDNDGHNLSLFAIVQNSGNSTSFKSGQDFTNLIINPNFAYVDGRGWQNPNGVTMTGGLSTYPCAEAYEKTFDVYQVICNLPNGIYKVTANAFYRPSANGSFNGTEEVPAQIYFNEFSAPVQHILADHSETELFNDGSWMADYMYADDVYLPNSMNGASTYFLQGKYLQEVYGLVDNGTMRLGIRSTATSGVGRWCLWTNFKLIYVGKDAEALSEILTVNIKNAAVLLADGSYMSAEAKSGLEAAIATATAASDADSMFDALVGLNTALSTANASITAYGDLATVVEELSTAIDWYAPTCSEEAQDAALALIDEVSTALVAGSYTDEEAMAKCDDVKATIAVLKVSAIEPTDEEPADFTEWIVNPAFDEAVADGWDITISDKSYSGYQGASYSNGSVTISQFIEVWRSGNVPLGDGDICQIIYYLPEGTYTLGCDIVANQQDGITGTAGVYLFAEQSDGVTDSLEVATGNGLPEHFEVIFTKKAGTAVTIGVRCASTTANWLAADNWTLTYFGKHSKRI